jgi:hypothetical protein
MDRPKSIKLKVTLLLLIKREMKKKDGDGKESFDETFIPTLRKDLEQHDKCNKRPRTIADFFMVSLSSMINVTSALGPSLISLW